MGTDETEPEDGSEQEEREYVESITSDVMGVLAARGFFAALDDRLCPLEASQDAEECGHNYQMTSAILKSKEFPEEHIQDVISVMQAQGGFCDCEILYNVTETSRLKAKYWKARAKEHESGP